jgi:phosphohistidine phosphatase
MGAIAMRRLMLLRHAKSDWSGSMRDHDRPLAPRGRKAAPRMGHFMAQHGLVPDQVLVSSATRTRETWELVQAELGASPPVRYDERIYEAAAERLLAVVRETGGETTSLLLVGHNPGLEELAGMLVAPGSSDGPRLAAKFPTTALAVLDFSVAGWAEIDRGGGRLDRFVTAEDVD